MISRPTPSRAFVWVWLPGATEPVPAGVLVQSNEVILFNYGMSYLDRDDAISLYLPELPLRRGRIHPVAGLKMPGCVSDASPDAWGRRVIRYRMFGGASRDLETSEVSELTYLLESGSNRIGALDFQLSADEYVARKSAGTLEEMQRAAERLERGELLSPDLDEALLNGSAVGGARPKALLNDGQRKLIAKFSSSTDTAPIVKAEGVAMELARRVGLNVAATEVTECMGRDVLLIERFDRTAHAGERRLIVSALTILELDEMVARYATYFDLVPIIQERFTNAQATLRELFSRIVFNICVGNTDDHARNHAAFWDGDFLTLTPAYDICPQPRSGGEAVQAMEITPGFKFSQLLGCAAGAETFFLSRADALEIIEKQLEIIRSQWDESADVARLTSGERRQMWGREILNPFALEGLGRLPQ